MNPVAKKHLPNQQMVKKVKGRTFSLPLPLEKAIKNLPRPENPINKNTDLYILVRGMPTKSKIVWEDIVGVNKVYEALIYLKNVNVHYSHTQLLQSSHQSISHLNENVQHSADSTDLQGDVM